MRVAKKSRGWPAKALPCKFQPKFIFGVDLRAMYGIDECPIIGSSADIACAFENMAALRNEILVVGSVDCKHRMVACDVLSIGSDSRVSLKIGDAFKVAVKSDGHAVFLAHNHPSGSLTPSKEDILLTNQLIEAGTLLGIPVLDHIIISSKGFCSLMVLGNRKRVSQGQCQTARLAADSR
jgi:DNA repair protein RadC